MRPKKIINNQRLRRTYRVRKKVRGDADRPRLCVNRTLKHFSAQLIDDASGKTLASASTKSEGIAQGGNCDAAKQIGEIIAKKASDAGVKSVRLDRGHCRYHGRVAAFAEAVRSSGIEL
ncbi:MAG TPA: 50S ribosomal protein L18 [Planctomycetaceae bacterium]|nr:50S ribosomal protein L18 [Planctomycetaceae bacterium]